MTDKDVLQEVYSELKETIRGQPEIARALATVGTLHYNRVRAVGLDEPFDVPCPTVLLSGGTGSGKTHSVKMLAQALGLPFYRLDASNISCPGWSGMQLTDHLEEWTVQNDAECEEGDYVSIDYGVLLIDEVDKLGLSHVSSGGSDVNKMVQYSLLDLIAGELIVNKDDKYGRCKTYETKNMLIILAGSFEDFRRSTKRSAMGFTGEAIDMQNVRTKAELQKTGIVPELAGRITIMEYLRPATDDMIRDVMLNSEHSAYQKYYRMFAFNEEQFVLGEPTIKKIIAAVKKSPSGLREIDTQVTQHVMTQYYKFLDRQEYLDEDQKRRDDTGEDVLRLEHNSSESHERD